MTEVPQQLSGGLANQGQVVRIGDTVRRPAGPHSEAVTNLLDHLRTDGFDAAPTVLGKDPEGRDVYEWIDGDVPIPPFPAWALTDEALISTARLIRRLHDALSSFEVVPGASWSDERSDPRGGPLICHTDICPENVVFRDGQAIAILDFDFASPGRPVWDLAMAARMWIPLRRRPDEDLRDATARRLGCLVAGYGLERADHEEFVDAIIEAQRLADQYRSTRRRRDLGLRLAHEARADAPGGDPAESLALREAFSAAFAQLEEGEREVLRLIAWDGLDVREGAEVGKWKHLRPSVRSTPVVTRELRFAHRAPSGCASIAPGASSRGDSTPPSRSTRNAGPGRPGRPRRPDDRRKSNRCPRPDAGGQPGLRRRASRGDRRVRAVRRDATGDRPRRGPDAPDPGR